MVSLSNIPVLQLYSYCTSKVVKPELVNLLERVRIGPVVLDDVDVVGCGQKTCKRRGL